ncbi:hypothetical protein BKA65DRAFT_486331 [Rhexocercosporidium sp. MPI-PUGE-AT-0058]|nr:hypothetical protein BKA65DRAFT_486331 [Rhexocercosporidium sp. MPI-PUGE-AT-0058]
MKVTSILIFAPLLGLAASAGVCWNGSTEKINCTSDTDGQITVHKFRPKARFWVSCYATRTGPGRHPVIHWVPAYKCYTSALEDDPYACGGDLNTELVKCAWA